MNIVNKPRRRKMKGIKTWRGFSSAVQRTFSMKRRDWKLKRMKDLKDIADARAENLLRDLETVRKMLSTVADEKTREELEKLEKELKDKYDDYSSVSAELSYEIRKLEGEDVLPIY